MCRRGRLGRGPRIDLIPVIGLTGHEVATPSEGSACRRCSPQRLGRGDTDGGGVPEIAVHLRELDDGNHVLAGVEALGSDLVDLVEDCEPDAGGLQVLLGVHAGPPLRAPTPRRRSSAPQRMRSNYCTQTVQFAADWQCHARIWKCPIQSLANGREIQMRPPWMP